MRNILRIFICSLFLLVSSNTTSLALVFTLDNYDIAANTNDPGLKNETAKLLPEPYNFFLGVGETATVNLFNIWTDETWVNIDDKTSQPIEVSFSFSSPQPSFGNEIDGNTEGNSFFGLLQWGYVAWSGPMIFNLGTFGDGKLVASLSDEIFNFGFLGLDPGQNSGVRVDLSLTYHKEPSQTPEPTTLLLFGTGLLGLAAFGRKKCMPKNS